LYPKLPNKRRHPTNETIVKGTFIRELLVKRSFKKFIFTPFSDKVTKGIYLKKFPLPKWLVVGIC